MPNWPFRFVHAADFHLEMPPFGIAEVPDHLRELLLESAYMAAQRVFDTVIGEEADFLVLSGDTLRCRQTGPRGPLFLVEQFERLASREISVYWSGGRVDTLDDWPPSIRLPKNVHRFPAGKPNEFIHRRDGTPLVRLVGASRVKKSRINTTDFDPAIPGLFAIAVAHGRAEPEEFKAARVDYWALGGQHNQTTVSPVGPMVHYAGSPQGSQPEEQGPHGCTLVQVDELAQIQTSLVPTDVLRWQTQEVTVEQSTTIDDLATMLDERAKSLVVAGLGVDQLILWKIVGSGPLISRLRNGPLAEHLLEKLRKQHGHATPALWSVGITAKPCAALPRDWYEPSSIRGDFLQTLKKLKKNPDQSLEIDSFLSAEADEAVRKAVLPGNTGRRNMLREAALLGADLLTGEEVEQ